MLCDAICISRGDSPIGASFNYIPLQQVEMDEFQNYEKALGALGESAKCLTKSTTQNEQLKEERLNDLRHRMQLLKKFIQIKRFPFVDTTPSLGHVTGMWACSNEPCNFADISNKI